MGAEQDAGAAVEQVSERIRRFVPNAPREAAESVLDLLGPWLVPPSQRPSCPLSGEPCRSWTCLVDVCVAPATARDEAQP